MLGIVILSSQIVKNLVITAGLLAFFVLASRFLIKWKKNNFNSAAPDKKIKLLDALRLGPSQSIYLVEVENEKYLINGNSTPVKITVTKDTKDSSAPGDENEC